jgi:hypothetical protein
VGDLDRVKCVPPTSSALLSPESCLRYVNPIQERRARNGPVGAQIAVDAAAAVPPPKPKKEARKSTAQEALHGVSAGGGEGNKCVKPKPGSTAAAAGNSGADAVGDADGACSGLSDIEKQLRTLRKKLRQIEIIESKDAPTQEELDKAAKKAEILAALAKLQV